ncbi:MAG: S-layer homology domain-containing protein [Oscillospiraceae bacterium]|jgi:hypothetical protein|nr:S-layer homology domain-containing protein [Oscillospiraceae bacterium]
MYYSGADGESKSAIALSYADYIELDDYEFDYSQSFSVAFWIQLTGAGAGGDPVIMGNKNWASGANPGWCFNHVAAGLSVNYSAQARGDIVAIPTAEMSAGEWNHVAVTFNFEDDEVKVYANGQVVGSESGKLGSVSLEGVGRLLLGQAYANGHTSESPKLYNTSGMYRPFNLDDFVMAQRSFTPAEVSEIYGKTSPTEPFVPESVIIVPSTLSLTKGSTMRFVAEVTGTGDKTSGDDEVTWTVTGAESEATVIDAGGNLTLGVDETSDAVTVRATSVLDNQIFGEAVVTVTEQRTDGGITFGVVSDTHVGSSDDLDVGNNARAKKAFQFYSAPAQSSDAVFVVGDLTSNGSWREFSVFQRLREYLTVPMIASMGNHDENQWDYFERSTGSLANDVKIINGYYFITVSPGAGTLDTATMRATQASQGSYDYIAQWLSDQIAAAEAADQSGKKPIFVFFHHPMRGTHYLSDEQGATGLFNTLSGHSNVVAFSGHTHGVNNHPLQIWQDGGFTTVNTAATCGGEPAQAPQAVSGNVPVGISESSQGLYVTADDGGNVSIKTRDFLNDRWLYDWTFNVNEDLPYTTDGRKAKSSAPEFASDAQIRITKINMTDIEFEFDRAEVTDGEVADFDYYYRYVFLNKATGVVEKEQNDWSGWYLVNSPRVIAREIRGLTRATEYELRIYAVNAYGLESGEYLSKTFSTTAVDNTYHTVIDYKLTFGDTLDNKGTAPDAVEMFGLESKPENYIPTAAYGSGKHGNAIHLQPNNFVTLDGGSEMIDYNQSFSFAMWVNVEYVRVDGDPVLLSNKNVDSSDNKGFAVYKEDGNRWLSLTFSPTSGLPGTLRLIELTPTAWIVNDKSFETDEWIHIAATFDYSNNKITAYVNGIKVGEADANLTGGIGGITGEGKNKSTFLGSSPWNYTEEHGGYNGSGSTNDVMHNGVLEPRKTISFLADDFIMSSCIFNYEEIAEIMGDIDAVPQHYTVTFDTDGGEPQPVAQEIYVGRSVAVPVEPSQVGLSFAGWYVGEDQFDFDAETVGGNLALIAKWDSINHLTVTAERGGSIITDASGNYAAGTIVNISARANSGYRFSGWTSTGGGSFANAGSANTTFTMPDNDAVITANFTYAGSGSSGGASGNGSSTSSSASSAGSTTNSSLQNPFKDVSKDAWYYYDIEYVCAHNIFGGTETDMFSPEISMTRGMIAAVLWRAAGSPNVSGDPFNDVDSAAYYSAATVWARSLGIINGVGGGNYAPNNPIMRQDLAVILYNFARITGRTLPALREYPGYRDDSSTANYAKEAIEALCRSGVISGKNDNLFDPKGLATRAEVAAMLHRLLEATGK